MSRWTTAWWGWPMFEPDLGLGQPRPDQPAPAPAGIPAGTQPLAACWPAGSADLEAEAWSALRHHDLFRAECRLAPPGDSPRWLEVLARCVHPHQPEAGSIWTFLDVTGGASSSGPWPGIETAGRAQCPQVDHRLGHFHQFRTPWPPSCPRPSWCGITATSWGARARAAALPDRPGGRAADRMLDKLLVIGKADARMLECAPHQTALGTGSPPWAQQLAAQLGYRTRPDQVHCEDAPSSPHRPSLVRWMLEPLVENAGALFQPDRAITIRAWSGLRNAGSPGLWIGSATKASASKPARWPRSCTTASRAASRRRRQAARLAAGTGHRAAAGQPASRHLPDGQHPGHGTQSTPVAARPPPHPCPAQATEVPMKILVVDDKLPSGRTWSACSPSGATRCCAPPADVRPWRWLKAPRLTWSSPT